MPSGDRRGFLDLKFVLACSVACLLCGFGWITREVFLELWVVARIFESCYVRSIFHPEHFSVEPHETPGEAMQARKATADMLLGMGPRMLYEDMAEVHDVTLHVKGGQVPLRIYVPEDSTPGSSLASKGVLLWLHGGGWVFGTVGSQDAISMDLAEASGRIVVAVGYRLAPEVKFPGPVKDCLAAIRWVQKNAWAFGGDPTRLAVVGGSTGANLGIAAAMQMSKSWIPLPFMSAKSKLCAIVASSPPLSYEHARRGSEEGGGEWRSYERYYSGYGLEGGQMKGYWDLYLSKESDGGNPLASPLRAKKSMLKGLPPVLLMRAEHEILWDEILEMGRRLADAGQKVTEIQQKGCIHGLFARGAGSCGTESLKHAVDFLEEHCS